MKDFPCITRYLHEARRGATCPRRFYVTRTCLFLLLLCFMTSSRSRGRGSAGEPSRNLEIDFTHIHAHLRS
ncbi:hypothetical protein PNOK_0528800 [Pyrrhoderma noxium]|uniref:Uncharacterized protein n=1 Tax=Pyrrhoderma noxium TaxID=2282107 RepID=A0A286UFR7_9AGAM|nr:hypothetical protein PNOK_0528800 [Pyrrhoderma noxium]